MYELHIHKHAQKALQKSPQKIKQKVFVCLQYLQQHGFKDCPFPMDTLKGKYKKYQYLEIKISQDYRLIVRREKQKIFIRYAGTHNSLGTG